MAIKITVAGAAGGEVTGSAYLVETDRARVLIDAGMFQGGKKTEEKNKLPINARPEKIDCVLLTHAHLDHTGRLPLLIKKGFKGTVYTTSATIDLAELILQDTAKLQAQDAARHNRHNPESPVEPLYTPEDAQKMRSMAKSVPFHTPIPVADGITARFFEAGHMLGSASIELQIDGKIILFSGDLGPSTLPIVREPDAQSNADVVFLESTYGDRDHRPYQETIAEFEKIVKDAAAEKGKILVPTFAIGRAQQALYHLAIMFFENQVTPFPVYLDSPLAIEASKVFRQHPDLFDSDLQDWQQRGLLPLNRAYFKTSQTPEESKSLNDCPGPCMILAGSGMCNGGRILHHLKYNISNPTTCVIMIGYQGEGSLGRLLVDGAKQIKIFGERLDVKAKIFTLSGFSAHAGQSDLLHWISTLAPRKPRVVLTHGENKQREILSQLIMQKYNLNCTLPNIGDKIEL